MDALDECEKEYRSALLSQIFPLQAGTTANILATSRPIQTIEKEFEVRSEMVKISAIDEDVERCLDHDMKTLPLLNKDNEGLSEREKEDLITQIKTTIIKGANGMFLLARLQLASLVDKTTVYEPSSALESPPKGQDPLAKAYGLTMKRIKDQRPGFRYLAKRVLIRLVHETTREYLASHMNCITPQYALANIANPMETDEKENIIAMAKAHGTFVIICVTYLSFSVFGSGFCQTEAKFQERLQLNQLYDYAADSLGLPCSRGFDLLSQH